MTYPYLKSRHTDLIVSVDEAKEWLRLDIQGYDRENALIEDLLNSAIGFVEDACNIQLGISTFQWDTSCLPTKIPDTSYVQAIISIKHRVDGVMQVIGPENYSLWRTGPRGSRIEWGTGFSSSSDRFTVEFTAGFPDGDVPPRLKMAVRVLTVQWYDKREDSVSEKKTFADKLISPYTVGYAG